MVKSSESHLGRDPKVEPARRKWDWSNPTIPPLEGTGGFLILELTGTATDPDDQKKKDVFEVRLFVAHDFGSLTWQPPNKPTNWHIVDVPTDQDTRRGSQISRAWKGPEEMVGDPVIVHGRP